MLNYENSEQPLADVIPIDRGRRVHRINGIKMNLARLTVPELVGIDEYCGVRVNDAQHERSLVQDELASRPLEGIEVVDLGGDAS